MFVPPNLTVLTIHHMRQFSKGVYLVGKEASQESGEHEVLLHHHDEGALLPGCSFGLHHHPPHLHHCTGSRCLNQLKPASKPAGEPASKPAGEPASKQAWIKQTPDRSCNSCMHVLVVDQWPAEKAGKTGYNSQPNSPSFLPVLLASVAMPSLKLFGQSVIAPKGILFQSPSYHMSWQQRCCTETFTALPISRGNLRRCTSLSRPVFLRAAQNWCPPKCELPLELAEAVSSACRRVMRLSGAKGLLGREGTLVLRIAPVARHASST